MGRGFAGKVAMDEQGHMEQLNEESSDLSAAALLADDVEQNDRAAGETANTPEAASYLEVFADVKTIILSVTGFFFQ